MPLSVEEDVSGKCQTSAMGTSASGTLPVMDEVEKEAERLKAELTISPTGQAIEKLKQGLEKTNGVLHVTCYPPLAPVSRPVQDDKLPDSGTAWAFAGTSADAMKRRRHR